MGVVAGCGGGGGQSGGDKTKTAEGKVKSFEVEKQKLRLKPQGKEAQVFKYNPDNIEVSLGGKDAKPEDIKKGQKAKVGYVVKNDRDVARSIELEKKKKK